MSAFRYESIDQILNNSSANIEYAQVYDSGFRAVEQNGHGVVERIREMVKKHTLIRLVLRNLFN